MPTSRRVARSPALDQVALPPLPDLVHVSEYAHDAAHCFREPSTPGPGVRVAEDHVTPNLHGRAGRAATGTTARADRAATTAPSSVYG
ncbi:hypothetical protein SGRIM128S_07093 [Streptomyces griseomycini]